MKQEARTLETVARNHGTKSASTLCKRGDDAATSSDDGGDDTAPETCQRFQEQPPEKTHPKEFVSPWPFSCAGVRSFLQSLTPCDS